MARTHGLSNSREYRCWQAMKARCTNPNRGNYRWYGGSFAAFIADVGRAPSNKHTLDRWPDNSGNYEPGNVRWATQSEQIRNARNRDGMLANLKVHQRRGVPKSSEHRAAMSRGMKGRRKVAWTSERRAAFSAMRKIAVRRERSNG